MSGHGRKHAIQAEINAGNSTIDQPLEDPDDVSVTNSEVESVMNHRRWREPLRHATFFDQEFNAFSSVDAYLGAARTGLEGIVNLLSVNMQVRDRFENRI